MWPFFITDMPGKSFTGEAPELSDQELNCGDQLRKHIETIAGNIGERNIWKYYSLEECVQYLKKTFTDNNFTVSTQHFEVHGKTVKNLEVELSGTTVPQEIIVVGAHYDTVLGSPGANDNGSGLAALLELANYVSNSQLDRTVRFVAWVNEEPPFFQTEGMGSWIYARSCRDKNEKIVAGLSLETIGYYSQEQESQDYPFPLSLYYPDCGNFIAFVGNLSSKNLVYKAIGSFRNHTHFPSEGIAASSWIPGIGWSDQWAFWKENYPAIMITDTAPYRYPFYHSAMDLPDKINYRDLSRVVIGLKSVITDLATSSFYRI